MSSIIDQSLWIIPDYVSTIHDLSFKSMKGIAYLTSSIVVPAVLYTIDSMYHPI